MPKLCPGQLAAQLPERALDLPSGLLSSEELKKDEFSLPCLCRAGTEARLEHQIHLLLAQGSSQFFLEMFAEAGLRDGLSACFWE